MCAGTEKSASEEKEEKKGEGKLLRKQKNQMMMMMMMLSVDEAAVFQCVFPTADDAADGGCVHVGVLRRRPPAWRVRSESRQQANSTFSSATLLLLSHLLTNMYNMCIRMMGPVFPSYHSSRRRNRVGRELLSYYWKIWKVKSLKATRRPHRSRAETGVSPLTCPQPTTRPLSPSFCQVGPRVINNLQQTPGCH